MVSEIPRRIRIDRMVPAELAIREAMLKVEETGADVRLTDAVNLLHRAQALVADFVDNVPRVAGAAPHEEPPARTEPLERIWRCPDCGLPNNPWSRSECGRCHRIAPEDKERWEWFKPEEPS